MTKLQKLRKTESKERAPSAVQQRIKRYQRELTGVIWVSLLIQSHYVARRPLNFSPPTHNIQTEICLFRNVPYPLPHFLGFSFSLSKTPSFDALKHWNVGCGNELSWKRLAKQAQGSKFNVQNPHQVPGMAACAGHPSSLGRTGQPAWSTERKTLGEVKVGSD